jgi:hypothetical protein
VDDAGTGVAGDALALSDPYGFLPISIRRKILHEDLMRVQ